MRFVAQELYYDVPEVRHLIRLPKTADLSNIDVIPQGYVEHYDDPSIDPDYSAWGNDVAHVNYTGLIPYLIQGFKEQQEIINEEKEKNQTQYNELLARIQALEPVTKGTTVVEEPVVEPVVEEPVVVEPVVVEPVVEPVVEEPAVESVTTEPVVEPVTEPVTEEPQTI